MLESALTLSAQAVLVSSAIDIVGDLISNTVSFFNGLFAGNPLYNWGSSF